MNNRADEEANLVPEGLEGLHVEAPPDTLDRFRKRASIFEGTRFVLERQIYGFWIVLNSLLKLLFKHASVPVPAPEQKQASRYRRVIENSKEGRQ